MITVKKMKDYIKENEMKGAGKDFQEKLDRQVKAMLDVSMKNAQDSGRKTVKVEDLPEFDSAGASSLEMAASEA